MRRYVILMHDHPFPHFDLMLEFGAVLRTWRLPEPPTPGCDIAAESIGDHRPVYLDYEGPVSGGRGTVTRFDAGTFVSRVEDADAIEIDLSGERLRGRLSLSKIREREWRCRYRPADAP